MNSKTLTGIGIGIGFSTLLLVGAKALTADEPQAPATREARQMDMQLDQLFARMGMDTRSLDLEEKLAMVAAMQSGSQGMNAAQGMEGAGAAWGYVGGDAGLHEDAFAEEALLMLGAFSEMLSAQGYGEGVGYGSFGSVGYGGSAGGWSGGDNYYNSRVGTGNYNADNSAGYVYIPGTGSVSYGM